MIDQRRSESLNRFLIRRATRRVKEPELHGAKPPASYFRKIRWKFSASRRSIIVRAGFFGVEIYWGAIAPLANNISIDERRWGVFVYPIFRIVPGANIPTFRWIRTEIIDHSRG